MAGEWFQELSGYPKESGGQGSGNAATRMFLVQYSRRFEFLELVCGGAQAAAYPAMPHCRLQGWSAEPFSSDLVASGAVVDPTIQMHTFVQANGNAALVTLNYGIDFLTKDWPTDLPRPEHRDDTQLRLRLRSGGKYLSIPGRLTGWERDVADDPGALEDRPMFTFIGEADFQLLWEFVDNPPLARLQKLIGKVNEDTFLTCPPETLLFEQFEIDDMFRPNPMAPHTNRVAIAVKYRNAGSKFVSGGDGGTPEDPFDDPPMVEEFFGWNHEYRDLGGEEEEPSYERILMTSDEPRYEPVPFDEIFT